MDLLLLLAAMIGAPLVIVGGVQLLIWKLIGAKALLLFASITFVASAIFKNQIVPVSLFANSNLFRVSGEGLNGDVSTFLASNVRKKYFIHPAFS